MSATNGCANVGEFQGKVVIVTGSSRGIGRGIALEFAKKGASVTIHGQSKEKLDETKAELLTAGIRPERILAVLGPMQESKTTKAIVQETLDKFGRIDVLVGHFNSVIELTELCVPHLVKTKGNIINISSIASLKNFTFMNPGPIYSNFALRTDLPMAKTDQWEEMGKNSTILARWGQPEEVANLVLFLASSKASFMTGGNYVVDGGVMVKN